MKEKVVLAYSGGLDTTNNYPVVKGAFRLRCCLLLHRLRSGNELDGLEERAKLSALPNCTLKIW